MCKKLFLCHDCDEDRSRIEKIRDSLETKRKVLAGLWDKELVEEARRKGREAIRELINSEFKGTSVTVVLIGESTYYNPWIEYEIRKSHVHEKGIIGIYIHNLITIDGRRSRKGKNPFAKITVNVHGRREILSKYIPVYDWVEDDGINNIDRWIKEAKKLANEI